MTSLSDLFNQHALSSFDKQRCLAEVLGERPWKTDFENGQILFGDDIAFGIQVIGSQSTYDNTWLWAWANTQAELPDKLLGDSRNLRDLGSQIGVAELEIPKFDLGELDSHYIAMIASGLCEADCYFRAPYHEGAAILLIPEATQVRKQTDLSAHYIMSRVMDYIFTDGLDQKEALESYLKFKGYSFEYSGQQLDASSECGEALTAVFDSSGRIEKMEAVVSPPVRQSDRGSRWK